jgi:chemotaxis protein MotB
LVLILQTKELYHYLYMKKSILFILTLVVLSTGCISKKKYNEQLAKYGDLKNAHDKLTIDLNNCLSDKDKQKATINALEIEIADLKSKSNALLNQLSDLSVITKAQAESIKKSLDNISSKDAYIKDLQIAMARKDSLNLALVMNLKGALKDINDTDIEIKVEGSAVFISISDKLLFKSGSYDITTRANEVLGKVAQVMKSQPDIQFMVEGHTDNKPIKTPSIKDNWDLSVLRATSVVRSLQTSHGIDPKRMIAAGRSEFIPMASNDNDNDRSLNRRTRIVILPQLDQFFKLIEPKN